MPIKFLLKNRQSRNKFKKLNCHPKNKTRKLTSSSCLDYKTLLYLKNAWNSRHPDDKISSRKRDQLWSEIKKKMSNSCDNELCWIDKSVKSENMKNRIKDEHFVPIMPSSWNKNPEQWLTSTEISNVMKQYESKHDDFVFIGPSPIDFDYTFGHDYGTCVWPELCNFKLSKHIDNGIKKVGFVFNTDKHYQSGSHWISMFLDLENKGIFFFDSVGDSPPDEIKRLMQKIFTQGKSLGLHLNVDENSPIKHQKYNSECGMYCLYFLISLIEKKHKMDEFRKKRIPDNLVKKFRTIYFNKL